jgi:ATP-dependent exoDNAse (exonuclease V) alpha subunit
MVRGLLTSGSGVQVVVGKAGVGKTAAVAVAGQAWTEAGYRVLGAAVAARAAAELEEQAGIPSMSITRLVAALRKGRLTLDPRTVLVIDEAGMLGTRPMASLIAAADAAGAKLVLLGDHSQVPEIGAGGLFRALADRLGAAELVTNHRFRQEWNLRALDLLRDYRRPRALAQAVTAWDRHACLHAYETVAQTAAGVVDAWWGAVTSADVGRRGRPATSVMLAYRRAEVDRLNLAARARMAAAGKLEGLVLEVGCRGLGTREFAAGDIVLFRRNNYRLGVLNGQHGTIIEVDPASCALTILRSDGRRCVIPVGYVQRGGLDYGYARTIHAAQGMTVDRAFVLFTDQISREAAYTALSRSRWAAQLFFAREPRAARGDHHGRARSRRTAVEELVGWLNRSRAQRLAHEQAGPTLPTDPVVGAQHRANHGAELRSTLHL